MLGGIEHDYQGVRLDGEVMTPDGCVSVVQWRHPDGRRFSATGETLTTALAMAVQMEKDRLEVEASPLSEILSRSGKRIPKLAALLQAPGKCDGSCPGDELGDCSHEKCPKCGAVALLKTGDGEACTMCPHLETSP